ncbi:CoA-transferase [Piscinibacter sakaiensis]|uniref:3-oxoadipate CoA-transferase, subunit B n=1 Tax=Piscinibacter sakaiensis TaxID=1547922 RepID=A0A0K8NUL7_PISS1|nr:CoA-transferase [Piscinibacter sakaiensis]GAP34096.1 3-oxoadipate CoA-transferase, subunit B [Piscinibacter sakaiensis]
MSARPPEGDRAETEFEGTPLDVFLLPAAIARALAGCEHVAIGSDGALHAAGALLAQALHGKPRVTILGSRQQLFFSDGGRELFEAAAQGRIDGFLLGGGQIDGQGNLNFMGRGDYPALSVRWPGNFGSPYLYSVVRRVVLVREEHSPRVMVPRVDYISAAGTGGPRTRRTGGPAALVTGRCVFRFDAERQGFALQSVHGGNALHDIRRETGFDFHCDGDVAPQTPPATQPERELLRTRVADALAPTYPGFANKLREAP